MIVSQELLFELQSVLMREKFRRYRPEADCLHYVVWLRENASLQHEGKVESISRDPEDDYLLSLAGSATADYIVSGDGDLLEIEDPPTPITSPRDFHEKIRDQREAT